MFDQFCVNDMFLRSLMSCFFALIPKVESPLELNDFRPICQLDSLYKFVANVLILRVDGVMGKLISLEQLIFVKGM